MVLIQKDRHFCICKLKLKFRNKKDSCPCSKSGKVIESNKKEHMLHFKGFWPLQYYIGCSNCKGFLKVLNFHSFICLSLSISLLLSIYPYLTLFLSLSLYCSISIPIFLSLSLYCSISIPILLSSSLYLSISSAPST